MTLVAAFRIENVPVLIGDLMAVKPASPDADSFNPMQPVASSRMPETIGYRFAQGRKKIHLINDNLVVGWSGDRIVAFAAIGALNKEFSDREAPLAELKEVLSSIDTYREFGDTPTFVIGWLFDGSEFQCFRWNSHWPTELFIHRSHFEGSGADDFVKVLTNADAHGMSPLLTSPEEQAPFIAIAQAGKLLANDIYTGNLTQKCYGYGFEILFWNGSNFSYVEDITFSFWEIHRLPNDPDIHGRQGPVLARYKSFDYFSMMQTTHTIGPHANNTFVELIPPVFDDCNDQNPQDYGPIKIRADYYCNYVSIRVPDGRTINGPIVSFQDQEGLCWVEQDGTKELLLLHQRNIYESMVKQLPGYSLMPINQ